MCRYRGNVEPLKVAKGEGWNKRGEYTTVDHGSNEWFRNVTVPANKRASNELLVRANTYYGQNLPASNPPATLVRVPPG